MTACISHFVVQKLTNPVELVPFNYHFLRIVEQFLKSKLNHFRVRKFEGICAYLLLCDRHTLVTKPGTQVHCDGKFHIVLSLLLISISTSSLCLFYLWFVYRKFLLIWNVIKYSQVSINRGPPCFQILVILQPHPD